jgi:peptide/nickel transport system permease protein
MSGRVKNVSSIIKKVFAQNKLAMCGASFLVIALICSSFAPLIAPYDPLGQSLKDHLKPPCWIKNKSNCHLLGTDHLGRDILSRMIYGTRVSFLVAFSAVGISMVTGVSLGLLAGFRGGWVDIIISRAIEVQLAVPYVLLAVTIILTVGPSLKTVIGVLAVRAWVLYARLVRGQVLSVKEEGYIASARAIGVSTRRILFRHVLPNVVNIIIVMATLELANMIILEAALSFLGLGVPPPAPSWGSMLGDGRNYISTAWWFVTFPGVAISISALSVNLVGDLIRNLLDPTERYRQA